MKLFDFVPKIDLLVLSDDELVCVVLLPKPVPVIAMLIVENTADLSLDNLVDLIEGPLEWLAVCLH